VVGREPYEAGDGKVTEKDERRDRFAVTEGVAVLWISIKKAFPFLMARYLSGKSAESRGL
jgi:hypothetical protein